MSSEADERTGLLSPDPMSASMVRKRSNLFAVTVVATIFFTGFGITLAPLIILQIRKICFDKYSYEQQAITGSCDFNKAQQENSSNQSLVVFWDLCLAILVSGKVGEFSDRFGRKKALIMCYLFFLVSFGFSMVLLSEKIHYNKLLWVVLRIIPGFVGSIKGVLGILRLYSIDIVPPAERVTALSVIIGTIFFGFAAGPMILALITSIYSDMMVLYVGFSFLLIAFLAAFFLPESHVPQSALTPSRLLRSLFSALRLLKVKSPQKQRKIWLLLVIDTITNSNLVSLAQLVMLFCTLYFHWGSSQIATLILVGGVSKAVSLVVLTPLYMAFLKRRGIFSESTELRNILSRADVLNIRLSIFMSILEVVIVVTTKRPIWIFLATILGSLLVINILTLHLGFVKLSFENVGLDLDSKIGELFGALALIENATVMIYTSSIMMLFSWTSTWAPKTVFVVMLSVLSVGFVCSLVLKDEEQDLKQSEVVGALEGSQNLLEIPEGELYA